MSDYYGYSGRTKLVEDEKGNIVITIDPADIWHEFSDETKEDIMQQMGVKNMLNWYLENELKSGVAGENYNRTLYQIRELIATNPHIVPEMVVKHVQELLQMITELKAEKLALAETYNNIYRAVQDNVLHRGGPYPDWWLKCNTSQHVVKQELGYYDHFEKTVKIADVREVVSKWFKEEYNNNDDKE